MMKSSGIVLLSLLAVTYCQLDLSGLIGDLPPPSPQQEQCILQEAQNQAFTLFLTCTGVNLQSPELSTICSNTACRDLLLTISHGCGYTVITAAICTPATPPVTKPLTSVSSPPTSVSTVPLTDATALTATPLTDGPTTTAPLTAAPLTDGPTTTAPRTAAPLTDIPAITTASRHLAPLTDTTEPEATAPSLTDRRANTTIPLSTMTDSTVTAAPLTDSLSSGAATRGLSATNDIGMCVTLTLGVLIFSI